VEGLEFDNTAQQLEILKLKARVKKLESLNKGRISVDIDEGIELVDDQEKDAQELHDDTPAETQSAKDKGKGIFVEDPKPMKKKDQIAMDA
nr:hypothetical protein [Tanacetum cinerariifolium]